jgi:hypothetical protein
LRKAVLVILSAAILLGGSGLSGAFASAVQHDLGVEQSSDGSLPDGDGRSGSCNHGCAAHLGVHLLAVSQAADRDPMVAVTVERGVPEIVQPLPFLQQSFFHPPRVPLA